MKSFYLCLLCSASMTWWLGVIGLIMSDVKGSVAKKFVQLFIGGVVMTALLMGLVELFALWNTMP